jgi:hypothetical protein
MKWIFVPRSDADGTERDDDDDDSAPGLLGLPPELLERHNGRVLDPVHAGMVDGYQRPTHTVYRSSTLMIPGELQRDGGFITSLNDVLKHAGMMLVGPDSGRDADLDPDAIAGRGDREVFEALRQLPVPTVLRPLPGYRHPVVVDAWTALQRLRAATVGENQVADEAPAAPDQPILDKVTIDRIGLEHLLVGSAINGSPIGATGGGLAGGSGGSAGGGPSITDSYLFNGGDARYPVALFLDPPARRPDAECADRYGRRPVIAVLDTGVRAHPWLDVAANPAGGYTMDPAGFVAIDDAIQAAIRNDSQQAATSGDRPRQVIKDAWDAPITDNPLIGELTSASGHGTFIAGIVRQVAPDARVLAVRIMHTDDVLYESDIICALSNLAKRIAVAEPGDLAAEVDVISLSFGYFSESRRDGAVTSGLWQAIEILLSLGVVVVAAAGNYASRRPFYPAAFAREPVPADQVPVLSVGALNPNGTKAIFSNDGRWVVAWALGASVISTYPTDVDASRTPDLRVPGNRLPPAAVPPGREALDPNDFSGGFADWSGTSFAAPYGAALIARSLLEGAERPASGLRLDSPGTAQKRGRAVAAVATVPRQIP